MLQSPVLRSSVSYSIYKNTDLVISMYFFIFRKIKIPDIRYNPSARDFNDQPLTAPTIIPFEKYFCINGYNAKIGKEARTVIVIRIPFGEMAAIACVISAPLDAVFNCSASLCASLR